MKDLSGIKIGVLGGGVSAERNISLISAKGVYQALLKNYLDAVFLDIFTSDKKRVKDIINSSGIDLAFIALHGEFGEDGRIQTILEELGIPYTGSEPKASFLAMDKICSKKIFINKGISTAPFTVCCDIKDIPQNLKFPLVVKPYFSGSSLGVSVVSKKSSLEVALRKAFSYQNKVILEDYIEGRELTVGILKEEPLGVVEIVFNEKCFDFNAKYIKGKANFVAPAELDNKVYALVQKEAQKAHKALGCRHFSRVDIRLNQDGIPYILEVNSIPGLTSRSLLPLSAKVCGLDFDKLILTMINSVFYAKKETKKV